MDHRMDWEDDNIDAEREQRAAAEPPATGTGIKRFLRSTLYAVTRRPNDTDRLHQINVRLTQIHTPAHTPHGHDWEPTGQTSCTHDGYPWPCPTVQLLRDPWTTRKFLA